MLLYLVTFPSLKQSNATWEEQKSAGKSVSTNQAATENSFDDLKDWDIVDSKDEDYSFETFETGATINSESKKNSIPASK